MGSESIDLLLQFLSDDSPWCEGSGYLAGMDPNGGRSPNTRRAVEGRESAGSKISSFFPTRLYPEESEDRILER